MNFSLYFIRLSFDNVSMTLCPCFVAVNKCFPQETSIIFVVFLNEFDICYSFNVSHQFAAHDPNSDVTLELSRSFQFAGQNEEISSIATVSVGHVMLPHRPAGRSRPDGDCSLTETYMLKLHRDRQRATYHRHT